MPNTTVMRAKRLGVLTCMPDTRLLEAAQRMTGEDVSALVVVDEEGYLSGILSRTDLIRAWNSGDTWANQKVREYMSPQVVTVGLNTTLAEVCELLLNERIHRVVVVRHEGHKLRPVGVVSAADVVYHMMKLEVRSGGLPVHELSTEVQPVSTPPVAVAQAAAGVRVSRRRLAIVLYGAVALLYWAALYTYVPTLPTYAATFTSNLALIGTILSMYGLWQAVARLPVGIASDWIGWRKPFIVLGLGLVAGGALLMASAHTPQALLIGRSVTGLAAATWVPLTVVFSSLYASDRAVQATTTLTVMSAIARVIATASNGPLNAIGGYSLAFLVAAVLAGIAILLVVPAEEARRPVKAPTAIGIGRLAARPDVLLPSMLSAVAHYVLMGVVYGFVPLLAKELGAADSMVSNLTVVHLGVFLPSVLAAAFLLKRFSARSLVIFSFVMLALGGACGAIAHSVVGLLAVQVLVGIGYGICYPILMGMSIEKVDASERATAMGLHQSVYAIGMFAGPWFSGILAASLGMRSMFWVTAIATLVIGVSGTLWATAAQQRAPAGRA